MFANQVQEAEVRFSGAGVVLALCVLASGSFAQPTATIKVDFEDNYSEGFALGASFFDSRSRIFFANSTAPGHNFIIDYGNNSSKNEPFFSNNQYLVANGFAPGETASLASGFGFTGYLPGPANHVFVDVGVSRLSTATCTVSMSGYDILGQVIDTDVFTLANPAGRTQTSLQLDSIDFVITRFVLSVDQCATGYDNITAVTVPEPESMILVISAAVLLGRRRRGLDFWQTDYGR